MILLCALFGCPSSTPPEPSAPATPAVTEAPVTTEDSACVKACMESRQMQAVGIDKIREDCRVECGEAPKPPF